MKLKTFFKSYLLFLSVLLAAISTISIYFTNRHMSLIHEQSLAEYERIVTNLEREIDALYERDQQNLIQGLIESHQIFQGERGVSLWVDLWQADWGTLRAYDEAGNFIREISFDDDPDAFLDPSEFLLREAPDIWASSFGPIDYLDIGRRYELGIHGRIQPGTEIFETNVIFDVTDSILELRQIQRTLLIFFITFSLIAAGVLYTLLNRIFQPLELVAQSTQKIAQGDYGERVRIKGTDELALVTTNFNQMAEVIEQHITHLKDESHRKQQFIDNLAHELRTPLTSIYGYAEYMQRANLDEEEKFESTTFIMEEAGHMRNITNAMLELTKLRNYETKLEKIDIDELFGQMKSSLEMAFQQQDMVFITESAGGVVTGQIDLLRSLITNLCVNGLKACAPGVGRVVLKGVATTHKVEISVVDNGSGIEKSHIAKLTEPFYQVDEVRNKRADGIGLGLAIVKQIVDIHEAELTIASEVGVGTEVKVMFSRGVDLG
ncbi:MAG: HAMP domain-containing histidine kinase [Turicibacter sp.]|nr:HAMP domain-containing histidine kinase [Turicibacter sp.]